MKLTFNCKEVSYLLSAGMDKTLPVSERARLRYHLVLCTACRNVDAQFDLLRRAMRQLGRDDPLGPEGAPGPDAPPGQGGPPGQDGPTQR